MFGAKNKNTKKKKRWKLNPIKPEKNKFSLQKKDGIVRRISKALRVISKIFVRKPEKKKGYSKKSIFISKTLSRLFLALASIHYDYWIISCLSGLIAGLCLPGSPMKFGGEFIAWFALAPLFAVIWLSDDLWQAFGRTFVAGLVFNLIGFRFLLGIHPLSWLGVPDDLSLIASYLGLIIAVLHQAIYWGIFGLFLKLLNRTIGFSSWTAIQGGIIWIVWQEKVANALASGGIPWTSYYYTQANNTFLIQVCDLFGGSAISFLLILSNLAIAQWVILSSSLKNKLNRNQDLNFPIAFVSSAQAVFLIAITFFYGISVFAQNKNYDASNSAKALLIQKNLSAFESRFDEVNNQNYLNLFKSLYEREIPDLIVMPEGAIGWSDQIKNLYSSIQSISPLSSLIGGVYFNQADKSYNAAFGLSALKGKDKSFCSLLENKKQPSKFNTSEQIYLKQALVPFGEYTPFEKQVTSLLAKLQLEKLGKSSFNAGNKAITFNFPFGRVSPLICFELIFPELFHKQIKAGAEAIVVIGDTSWFNEYKSTVAEQMLAAAKFRAIEGRRDILISVNKGPLARIDKFGKIKDYSQDAEFLFTDFHLNSTKTLATKSYL